MSHYDVVEAKDERWSVPPFGRTVKDGYIWGRGSQDMKGHLAALMEAAEILISEGFKPARSVYFAFGGDEEVMGIKGAGVLSGLLKERGLTFEYVFDEGGFISEEQLKGVLKPPVAMPGIAEKGLVSLHLTVRAVPGHSSRPGRKTAIGVLCRAMAKLDRKPFPYRFTYTTRTFFSSLAEHSRFLYRIIFRNLWLFRPVLLKILTKDPSMASLFHTTQAMTIISSGEQDNILPDTAEAVINYRILHGENIESVLHRIRKLTEPMGVEVAVREEFPPNEPIPPGSVDSTSFKVLSRTISEVFPSTITAPFLMPASTDSKQYADLSRQIYRFSPFKLSAEELSKVHGIDERLSVENFHNAVRFFIRLMENSSDQL